MITFWQTELDATSDVPFFRLLVNPAFMMLTLRKNLQDNWCGSAFGFVRTWNGTLTVLEAKRYAVKWLLETVLPTVTESVRDLLKQRS